MVFCTPLVISNCEVKMLGLQENILKMQDHFMNLNSVTILLKTLHQTNPTFQCPFLSDIPLCSSHYKDDHFQLCLRNAFSIRHKITNDNHCQYSHGLFLLGIAERLD